MKKIKLSPKERKIYNSIMTHFPKTKKETAYYWALQGGIKFDLVGK